MDKCQRKSLRESAASEWIIDNIKWWACDETNMTFETGWGLVTHIYVSKLTIIGSDNGLSPGRRQAIIGTNAGILLIWPMVKKTFGEILIGIQTFSFNKCI